MTDNKKQRKRGRGGVSNMSNDCEPPKKLEIVTRLFLPKPCLYHINSAVKKLRTDA